MTFMAENITSEMAELLRKYAECTSDLDVAVGLRPSGTIHLGNMATMVLAGILAHKLGRDSRVNTTICDLDFPELTEWNIYREGYVKFFRDIPDKHDCHPNMLEHAADNIYFFTSSIEKALGIRYQVQFLSDVQNQPGFRHSLKNIIETPGLMKQLLPSVPKDRVLVYPICPNCRTCDHHATKYRDGNLFTRCTNPECPVDEHDMKIDDCSRDLAVHYLIDPLRDRAAYPKSKFHVFGGDYRDIHGGGISKIEKIVQVMGVACPNDIPEILIGPMFYAKDGTKMSKTRENGLTLENLKNYFGSEYQSRVLQLMQYITEREMKNVDYKIVEDVLFKGLLIPPIH